MKSKEIERGNHYLAKVNGRLVAVKVDEIETRAGSAISRQGTRFHVTSLVTGRKTIFRSAAKFKSAAIPLPVVQQLKETL